MLRKISKIIDEFFFSAEKDMADLNNQFLVAMEKSRKKRWAAMHLVIFMSSLNVINEDQKVSATVRIGSKL